MEELLATQPTPLEEGLDDNAANWLITQPEEIQDEWFSINQLNVVCTLCR